MNPDLEQLEQQRLVWRGRDAARPLAARSSGWPELDEQLGGLPGAGVVVIQARPGVGELRLLWPSMALEMAQESRLTALVAPPYRIGAEGWLGAGLTLEHLLVVHPDTTQSALWAAEQSLKSGSCHSVCLWLEQRLQSIQARRLQLAARAGQATLFLFVAPVLADTRLPVDLHLAVSPCARGVRIEVLRRRQGRELAPFTVTMTEQWPELTRSRAQPDRQSGQRKFHSGTEAV